jgi:TetR/AcrR family transcriptional repressor of nem operon
MKKHSKEHVLSIGEALFRTQGYFNTGTKDILKKAEYPRSSFYYLFKTKEKFAIEVLERYGNQSSAFYQSVLLNKQFGSPLHRLRKFAELLTKNAASSHFQSECLIQKFSIECAGFNEALKECTRQQLNKLLNIISQCVAEGQAADEIIKTLSSFEIAEFIHSQIYGSFILSRLQNSASPMEKSLGITFDSIQ